MNYWSKRQLKTQEKLTKKSVKETEEQLRKYYSRTMKKIIGQFEATYNKLLSDIAEGKEPTPADLYKLDKYWEMQGQLKVELQKLGDKQAALLSKKFTDTYLSVYQSFALQGKKAYTEIDRAMAEQMINQIWCADGKSWSSRVWTNIDELQETLNAGLIECVVAGKKTTDLKNKLQERFNVSYNRADRLVRTEMAHIQTAAAAKRYQDYGLEYYEILGNDDDSCGHSGVDCHKMDGKRFRYSEMSPGHNAPPFHPNCKCSIIPVVE